MPSDPGLIVYPYLGKGEQGEMRLDALKRIAEEAGCLYEDEPSLSRWLQHLADERIAAEGTGYYAAFAKGRVLGVSSSCAAVPKCIAV